MQKLFESNSLAIGVAGALIGLLNICIIKLLPFYLYGYFIIILILVFALQKNIISIYGRINQAYTSGNSYIKRMFATVGLFTIVIYMLFSVIVYLISIINGYAAVGLFVVIVIIPFEPLLIKVWEKYDYNKYYQIDCQNPGQKKFWGEAPEVYKNRTKWYRT